MTPILLVPQMVLRSNEGTVCVALSDGLISWIDPAGQAHDATYPFEAYSPAQWTVLHDPRTPVPAANPDPLPDLVELDLAEVLRDVEAEVAALKDTLGSLASFLESADDWREAAPDGSLCAWREPDGSLASARRRAGAWEWAGEVVVVPLHAVPLEAPMSCEETSLAAGEVGP